MKQTLINITLTTGIILSTALASDLGATESPEPNDTPPQTTSVNDFDTIIDWLDYWTQSPNRRSPSPIQVRFPNKTPEERAVDNKRAESWLEESWGGQDSTAWTEEKEKNI